MLQGVRKHKIPKASLLGGVHSTPKPSFRRCAFAIARHPWRDFEGQANCQYRALCHFVAGDNFLPATGYISGQAARNAASNQTPTSQLSSPSQTAWRTLNHAPCALSTRCLRCRLQVFAVSIASQPTETFTMEAAMLRTIRSSSR